jgi:hypothetical protein
MIDIQTCVIDSNGRSNMKNKLFNIKTKVCFAQSKNCILCLHIYKYAIYFIPGFKLFNLKLELFTINKFFRISFRRGQKRWL